MPPILLQLGSAEKGGVAVPYGAEGRETREPDSARPGAQEQGSDDLAARQQEAIDRDDSIRVALNTANAPLLAFQVGDRVRLALALRYLKTADPMPMLRPPDLVTSEEIGVVSEIRARDQLAVRFRRGTFLLAAPDIRLVSQRD